MTQARRGLDACGACHIFIFQFFSIFQQFSPVVGSAARASSTSVRANEVWVHHTGPLDFMGDMSESDFKAFQRTKNAN